MIAGLPYPRITFYNHSERNFKDIIVSSTMPEFSTKISKLKSNKDGTAVIFKYSNNTKTSITIEFADDRGIRSKLNVIEDKVTGSDIALKAILNTDEDGNYTIKVSNYYDE